MNRKQRINKILINKYKEFTLEIIDNSHLHLGHNRLKIHRTINELIKNEYQNGLHSLEIKIS